MLAIYQLCQSMPGTAQGQAGTSRDKQGQSRDKAGTNRDKQGQAGTFPFCPCFSLLIPVCPCLSMLFPACPSFPVCPCLSLFVPVCPYLSPSVPVCPCMSLHLLNLHVFPCRWIYQSSSVWTFLAKATVSMHGNPVFNFFFTFILFPQYLFHPI